MRTSRKLTHVLSAIFAVLAMSVAAMAADPGIPVGLISNGLEAHPTGGLIEIGSDMKAGSILAYTHYRSDSNNSSATDARINITNVHPTMSVVVHFFFVNSNCSVADFKTELTQNQTYSFLASDFDPDQTGYLLAVAEDEIGLPISWNYLIGDAYVKLSAVYSINLSAISYAARYDFNTQANGKAAVGTNYANPEYTINFGGAVGTGGSYDALGRSFAVDNIPSRAGGDRVWLVYAGVRGDYRSATGGSSSTMFGILYDDAEQGQSFQWSFDCAGLKEVTSSFPRTAPRLDTVVPAGRTGWIRTYHVADSGAAMSMIVYNTAWSTSPSANFHGAHNLHVLTRTSAAQTATLPVFPFELQTN
ncbi:MAG: hypothetical protein EBU88_11540 [Acidobacteria bacterium]|nr:hypothetical protein [Acidobacteriota bacterium]